ncbi:hypothetical protein [Synergistes jonesii]|uniref:Uncharacterized protein n=1 Tax=Synergistes jonesii TaxID=2754 RepID=A0A073IS76_9BACT|nr:hypothetical protein [Synergistes jonesii]KEJ93193.1 hypothetical protein EH55_12895 [Synergistes jonesii]OFB60697.1 hypothetical protein JS72_12010 [Synergistes jonesii]OFB64806.1 hypothetical protein JS73_02875 [Synergistes jonesii]OFB66107.1 hypothetical protein JS79_02880 [Synergistes jonesii]OFB68966.1 hypothetical protein JS78_02880 [Synergistes jonesii]
MKSYIVTEKQLDELKKLYERCKELLRVTLVDCFDFGEDEHETVKASVDALAEPLRELKFLVEDIERQEADS